MTKVGRKWRRLGPTYWRRSMRLTTVGQVFAIGIRFRAYGYREYAQFSPVREYATSASARRAVDHWLATTKPPKGKERK